MEGTIRLKPLSVNDAWRGGRRYRTKEYIQYETELLWLLKKYSKNKVMGFYHLRVDFFMKNFARCDVSNYIKCLEDCMVKAGLVEDDRYCISITVTKTKSDKDFFMWEIIDDMGKTKK